MRNIIWNIIGNENNEDYRYRTGHNWYVGIMLLVILASIVPALWSGSALPGWMRFLEIGCGFIFIADYLARWSIADRLYKGARIWGRMPMDRYWGWKYLIAPMALIDLLSILPIFIPARWMSSVKLFRFIAMGMRMLRTLKLFAFVEGVESIGYAIRKSWQQMAGILIILIFALFVSSLVITLIDPNGYRGWQAIYQALASFTTIRDVDPPNQKLRLVSAFTALIGVGMVALPAGILTSVYMSYNELQKTLQETHDLLNDANRKLNDESNQKRIDRTYALYRSIDDTLRQPGTLRSQLDEYIEQRKALQEETNSLRARRPTITNERDRKDPGSNADEDSIKRQADTLKGDVIRLTAEVDKLWNRAESSRTGAEDAETRYLSETSSEEPEAIPAPDEDSRFQDDGRGIGRGEISEDEDLRLRFMDEQRYSDYSDTFFDDFDPKDFTVLGDYTRHLLADGINIKQYVLTYTAILYTVLTNHERTQGGAAPSLESAGAFAETASLGPSVSEILTDTLSEHWAVVVAACQHFTSEKRMQQAEKELDRILRNVSSNDLFGTAAAALMDISAEDTVLDCTGFCDTFLYFASQGSDRLYGIEPDVALRAIQILVNDISGIDVQPAEYADFSGIGKTEPLHSYSRIYLDSLELRNYRLAHKKNVKEHGYVWGAALDATDILEKDGIAAIYTFNDAVTDTDRETMIARQAFVERGNITAVIMMEQNYLLLTQKGYKGGIRLIDADDCMLREKESQYGGLTNESIQKIERTLREAREVPLEEIAANKWKLDPWDYRTTETTPFGELAEEITGANYEDLDDADDKAPDIIDEEDLEDIGDEDFDVIDAEDIDDLDEEDLEDPDDLTDEEDIDDIDDEDIEDIDEAVEEDDGAWSGGAAAAAAQAAPDTQEPAACYRWNGRISYGIDDISLTSPRYIAKEDLEQLTETPPSAVRAKGAVILCDDTDGTAAMIDCLREHDWLAIPNNVRAWRIRRENGNYIIDPWYLLKQLNTQYRYKGKNRFSRGYAVPRLFFRNRERAIGRHYRELAVEHAATARRARECAIRIQTKVQ
ncbi:MAG: ion transporter [Abditibacteriota bacterium]|nr:ion transporter [Abditibacteriota bacterium]